VRSQWRGTIPATAIADGPRSGATLLADPTLTGASVGTYLDTIYLSNETVFAALDKLAARTYGSSQNLLANPNFVHDPVAGGSPTVIDWSLGGSSWLVEAIDPGQAMDQHAVHISGTNRSAGTGVSFAATAGGGGTALLANTVVGAAISIISTGSASAIRIAFDDHTGAELFGATIPAALYPSWTRVAFAVRTKAMPANVSRIRLIVDGAVLTGDTYISRAWLAFGMPPVAE
jgi:hypothetical protein